jgi:hypothetical protein
MKIMGYNALAILVAAIAIYAVGVIIYALILSPEAYMAAVGYTKEQMDAVGMSRMPYSPIMPIVTAVGMAVLFKWANVSGLSNGVKYGVLVALISAVPAMWYVWVYGVGPAQGAIIDSAHLLIGHAVAGAILGSWKK